MTGAELYKYLRNKRGDSGNDMSLAQSTYSDLIGKSVSGIKSAGKVASGLSDMQKKLAGKFFKKLVERNQSNGNFIRTDIGLSKLK